MQEIKASWEMDHDQAQNKSLSLDWPRGRSMKFFISKLKKYLFFYWFLYAVVMLSYYATMIILLTLIKHYSVQPIKQ